MRRLGFEPRKALSYYALNVARLAAPASPHFKAQNSSKSKFCYDKKLFPKPFHTKCL